MSHHPVSDFMNRFLGFGADDSPSARFERLARHLEDYGLNSPEFFDRSMFENFIDLLRSRGVIRSGNGGKLEFDEVLMRVAADAQFVLSEQIRHSILQVTHS